MLTSFVQQKLMLITSAGTTFCKLAPARVLCRLFEPWLFFRRVVLFVLLLLLPSAPTKTRAAFSRLHSTALTARFVLRNGLLRHFGANVYWLGNYTRTGAGVNNTTFVPATPQQSFGPGPTEGHGYFSASLNTFVWWGWINGRPPPEVGVPAWDSVLSVARAVTYDGGLSTVGDFNGMLRFYPVSTIKLLRGALLLDTRDALGRAPIPAHETVFPLKAAAGHLLDVEINITWEGGDVPVDFGSVGVSVLGATAPAPAAAAVGAGGCAERRRPCQVVIPMFGRVNLAVRKPCLRPYLRHVTGRAGGVVCALPMCAAS